VGFKEVSPMIAHPEREISGMDMDIIIQDKLLYILFIRSSFLS